MSIRHQGRERVPGGFGVPGHFSALTQWTDRWCYPTSICIAQIRAALRFRAFRRESIRSRPRFVLNLVFRIATYRRRQRRLIGSEIPLYLRPEAAGNESPAS